MSKKKDKSWLKPRGYIHFTKKFDRYSPEDTAFLHSYVSTPETIASHRFFPLIHRPIIARRYKRVEIEGEEKRVHSYIKDGKKKSTAKTRHIYYSTHIDAYIYSYYCKEVLSPLYEKKVREVEGLSDCISAYREIPVHAKAQANKNNIHFADDAFKFIKEYGDCVALTFDVSAFFDSLNQKYLKQQWCRLFDGATSLTKDHHNVYKSLTRVSYVEYYKVLKEFGIKNQNKLKSKKYISFCSNIEEFRKRIQAKKLIKYHPFMNAAKDTYIGIPQGTPISAFLSNLYMLEFDKLLHKEVMLKRGGLYRRYSDDIIVVCRPHDKKKLEKFVLEVIDKKFHLTINSDKVDVSNFKATSLGLQCDNPLTYLGFEFDGKQALIKAASIGKFYRQMKRAVKAQSAKARHNKGKREAGASTAKIYKHDLFKKYSHLGTKGKDRNFYIYAKEAAQVMNEVAIKRQLSQTWENLNKEIKKYEARDKLLKP